MKNKQKIFLDYDGVIVNTPKAIVDLYNEDFSYYENYKHVNWWEINTWNFEECKCATNEVINTYFNQPRFFDKLEPMAFAIEVIKVLQHIYDIKIVSHGFSPNLRAKELWINEYFTGIEFIGVDLKKYKDKSHIDMSDGIFIDDNYRNLTTSNATEKYCFGDMYSWNEKWKGKRLLNWTDVYNTLLPN